MKVQCFILIVCSLLVGCHTDSGINPSPYTTSLTPSYKCDYQSDLPECNEKREGLAIILRSFSPDRVFVCSDGMWVYLRDATQSELNATPKYVPSADKDSDILVEKGSVVDPRDMNTYQTVKIGNQVWFAANLEYGYSYYEDYDGLCFLTSGSRGCLYTWENIMAAGLSQNDICPDGFHVPTREEWNTLITNVGGHDNAGLVLQVNDGISNDAYMFSVKPSGYYDSDASYSRDRYSLADNFAPFWTSSFASSSSAYAVLFYKGNPAVNVRPEPISDGYAIRCLKD
jgi:uncharacterized protein (TIGR02145 family)